MNKVLAALLFSGLFLTGQSFAQNPPAAVVTPAPVAPVATPHHVHFPEIHKAMHKLRDAKQALEKASRDFGGHKEKALDAINEALLQLQAALDYAKNMDNK